MKKINGYNIYFIIDLREASCKKYDGLCFKNQNNIVILLCLDKNTYKFNKELNNYLKSLFRHEFTHAYISTDSVYEIFVNNTNYGYDCNSNIDDSYNSFNEEMFVRLSTEINEVYQNIYSDLIESDNIISLADYFCIDDYDKKKDITLLKDYKNKVVKKDELYKKIFNLKKYKEVF